jgi:hypothetical protein
VKVPVIIGANDRDLPIGLASTKDGLFAEFEAEAAEARRLYGRQAQKPKNARRIVSSNCCFAFFALLRVFYSAKWASSQSLTVPASDGRPRELPLPELP